VDSDSEGDDGAAEAKAAMESERDDENGDRDDTNGVMDVDGSDEEVALQPSKRKVRNRVVESDDEEEVDEGAELSQPAGNVENGDDTEVAPVQDVDMTDDE